jgi:hypothetical protein
MTETRTAARIRIPGHATPEGTAALARRFASVLPHGHAPLGGGGLTVSRIGFGSYRVDDATPDHRQALVAALAAGCNLIDTSTNYTDGGSERLIGRVLAERCASDPAARASLVIVSKIGYVQGRNLEAAIERERAGRPFPDMVRYMDGCWHCIHPEFLRDQLERSLDRLGLATLDVCLLHNPEYFLADARHRGGPGRDAARGVFHRRLRDAFACLEEAVRDGTIRCYGVSSNTAVSPADDFEATSVTRMLRAAEEAAGPRHRFRVLQFPLNLFEAGGALERNTGPDGRATPLEAAAAAGLGVLINRPLNAILGQRLLRLADAPPADAGPSIEACGASIAALEREFRAAFVAPGSAGAGRAAGAADPFFDLVRQIAGLPSRIDDHEHWRQVEEQHLLPRLHFTVSALRRALPDDRAEAWGEWWDRFLPALQALLEAVGRATADSSRRRAVTIRGAIDPLLPPERREESLSRKAIWTAASTAGVSTVLVGMRRRPYVEDAMGTGAWPPLPDPLGIYRRLGDARLEIG